MASANPLLALILRTGVAPGPYDAAKVSELKEMAVKSPDLLNAPLNGGDRRLPLNIALSGGFLAAAQALQEVATATGKPFVTVNNTPLQEAAWSANLPTLAWVWDTGLDTALASNLVEKAMSPVAVPVPAREAAVKWLLAKGARPNDAAMQLAVQTLPSLATLFVTEGFLNAATLGAGGLQCTIELTEVQHPLTYALLPNRSNALFVALGQGSAAAPEALVAALTAALAEPTTAPVNSVLPLAPNVGPALHFALSRGLVIGASVLVSAGADPTATSPSGESIVGAAARSGVPDAVQHALTLTRALAPGAVLALTTTPRGIKQSPLVTAIRTKRAADSIVPLLLAAGADPSDASAMGVNAAFHALYVLQDRAAAAAAGYTKDVAKAVVQALVAGNPKGQRVDLDKYDTTARTTVRAMATEAGISFAA